MNCCCCQNICPERKNYASWDESSIYKHIRVIRDTIDIFNVSWYHISWTKNIIDKTHSFIASHYSTNPTHFMNRDDSFFFLFFLVTLRFGMRWATLIIFICIHLYLQAKCISNNNNVNRCAVKSIFPSFYPIYFLLLLFSIRFMVGAHYS